MTERRRLFYRPEAPFEGKHPPDAMGGVRKPDNEPAASAAGNGRKRKIAMMIVPPVSPQQRLLPTAE
jgi:hypothetical protein